MTYAVSTDTSRHGPSGVGATLGNIRRTVGLQLAAPLDAKPNAWGASGPVDVVLAAVLVALVGFGVVMVYTASAVQATVQYHGPQFSSKGRQPTRSRPSWRRGRPAASTTTASTS